jgi:hypothetical protein
MKWVTADGGFVGYIDPRESADLQSIPASKHIGLDDSSPTEMQRFVGNAVPCIAFSQVLSYALNPNAVGGHR